MVKRPVEQVRKHRVLPEPQSPRTMRSCRGWLHEVCRMDTFRATEYEPGPTRPATRTIGAPQLGVGIGDVRGLVGVPSLRVKGRPHTLLQGQGHHKSGLHATLAVPAEGATLAFDTEFKFSPGTKRWRLRFWRSVTIAHRVAASTVPWGFLATHAPDRA
jgi:hypothetical protein